MQFIRNLNIRKKLLFSFLIVVLFLLAVGILGISNMSKISRNDRLISDNNVPSLDKMTYIRQNVLEMRSNTILALDMANSEKRGDYLKIISDLTKLNNELLEGYNALPSTNAEEDNITKQCSFQPLISLWIRKIKW